MASLRFVCMAIISSVLLNSSVGCADSDLGVGVAVVVATAAVTCETDARCNDGAFCNGVERCLDRVCRDGEPPCGNGACDDETRTCAVPCTEEQCGDGMFCNGVEFCTFPEGDPNGFCTNGDPPCFSDEVCVEDRDACVICDKNSDCPDGNVCVENFCVEGSDEPAIFDVHFRNEDITTVHILTAAEDFDSSNRLSAGGGSRIVTMAPSIVGDIFTFRAGANGSVFATVDCTYDPDPIEDAVVTWTGFELDCSGDLR